MTRPRYRFAAQGCRAHRLHYVALNFRPVFLELCRAAAEGSAGSGEIAEGIHPAAGLLQNLGRRVQVVRQVTAAMVELVGTEGVSLPNQALRFRLHPGDVVTGDLARFRARRLVHQHQFRPQRRHHASPLGGIALRHHGYERVALHGAHDGEPGAGVAAGQLNHRLARAQLAARLGLLHHL